MIFWRILALLFVAIGASAAASETRARPTRPSAAPAADPSAYKGAIVIDAGTGNVLHEDRADIVSPPASMTKLMTYAVVYDVLRSGRLQLDTPVKITPEDARMGGTQVFLDPRETFSVEDLIYAMMIQSANDASHALARAAAGSVPAFVELMNAKAQELGMANTTFRTPHGLPPPSRNTAEGDLTSPRDFAKLGRHLVQNTDALKYTSVRTRSFGEGTRAKPMMMVNHNHLLGKVAGVDGLKTGFTNGAGFCLSATAQRDSRRVIVVTMGSAQAKTRDLAVAALIERGLAMLPAAPANRAPAMAPRARAEDSPIRPAPAPERQAPPQESPPIKFSIPKA
jgi:D-alanyl-D-alanine carboxypeptidase (penicillin-binding protein 5/6)